VASKDKNTNISVSASSQKLVDFLEQNNLHKKDFAEMIGVTLSYVYSLIDPQITFSTRTTTLERIAVVMGISPHEFPEYKASIEPLLTDPGIEFLKQKQQEAGISNLDFIRKFPRSRRVEIVDLWREALPLPLDWNYLHSIAQVLNVSPEEIYPFWRSRMQQYLIAGGFDIISNAALLHAMFEGAKSHISK